MLSVNVGNFFKVRCNFRFKIFNAGPLLSQFLVHCQELKAELVIVFLENFAFALDVTHHKGDVYLLRWVAIIEHVHKDEIIFQHDINSFILWMVCRSTPVNCRRQITLPYRSNWLFTLSPWPFQICFILIRILRICLFFLHDLLFRLSAYSECDGKQSFSDEKFT